jgi:transcriptional regulator with PAS, ATPase and Fis domain
MTVKKFNSRNSTCSDQYLVQIFENLPDPIFVTDADGNVLLSNSTTAYSMDMSLGQLLKSNLNELVEKGYYNFSHALETVKTKKEIRGEIITNLGMTYSTKSTPILDEYGNVTLVVTCGKQKDKNSDKAKGIDEQRKREIDYLRSYVFNEESVIAESRVMQKTLLTAHAVAQTDSNVLLYGETGTGKEVLAKYVHRHSKRADGPFIVVNCATLPENLVESELFGYKKGAFTGALNSGKVGLFEAANGGTLFLDEIAELPLAQQAALLRVLETKTVRRIGSNTEHKTDFRLVAATNKDLKRLVDKGCFRHDLYYRINIVPITIPPLRERPEDILALSQYFIDYFNAKYSSEFKLDAKTTKSFQQYDWPGNVRELRNIIERNVIINLSKYNEDTLSVIPDIPDKDLLQYDYFKLLGLSGSLKDVVKKVEESYIRYILKKTGGKKGEAAKKLGIHRTILYRKLKEFDRANETESKSKSR